MARAKSRMIQGSVRTRCVINVLTLAISSVAFICVSFVAAAQVDQSKAQQYFKEAAALCERDGGKLWGISLCGPMVIADAVTLTIATSEPAPADKRPATLGFANAIATWGGKRWSTYVWSHLPADERERAVLLIHELFHRVQRELGFFLNEPDNSHLDSVEGRYWLQLEWKAL